VDDNCATTLDWDALVDTELSAPMNIPQTNRFLGTKIFVRDCYPHYYDMVVELLHDYRMVSVTGMPGCWKDLIFSLIQTHKSLAASFTVQTKLSQCLYSTLKDGQTAPPKFFTGIPSSDVCDLYHNFMMVCQMICHPVPARWWQSSLFNLFGWIKIASKYPDHEEIYMPNGRFLAQHTTSNVLLGLNVSTEGLRCRNELFCGTASYTLTDDSCYVNKAIQNILKALGNIRTLDQIQDSFSNVSLVFSISHKLVYYFPCADGSLATFKLASACIAKEIEKNVRLGIKNARASLR